MKTGWPPGMLQDDDNRLSRWLANRPGARYQVRKNMIEQQPEALRLAKFLDCLDVRSPDRIQNCVSAAAELRHLHSVNTQLLEALEELASEWGHYTDADIEYEISQGNQMIVPFKRARAAIAAARGQV